MTQGESENPVVGHSVYIPPSQCDMQDASPDQVPSSSGYSSTQGSDARRKIYENAVARHKYAFQSRHSIHRQRRTLPKEATKYLLKWLAENCFHPFPDEDEKRQLIAITQLTGTQVSNWLINARRRKLPGILEPYGCSVDEVLKRKTPKVKKPVCQDENTVSQDENTNFLNEQTECCKNPETCYYHHGCMKMKVDEMVRHIPKADRRYKLCLLYATAVIDRKRDELRRNQRKGKVNRQ